MMSFGSRGGSSADAKTIGIIAGSVGGAIILVAGVLSYWFCCCKKVSSASAVRTVNKENESGGINEEAPEEEVSNVTGM